MEKKVQEKKAAPKLPTGWVMAEKWKLENATTFNKNGKAAKGLKELKLIKVVKLSSRMMMNTLNSQEENSLIRYKEVK